MELIILFMLLVILILSVGMLVFSVVAVAMAKAPSGEVLAAAAHVIRVQQKDRLMKKSILCVVQPASSAGTVDGQRRELQPASSAGAAGLQRLGVAAPASGRRWEPPRGGVEKQLLDGGAGGVARATYCS